jgi:hypothetical protein
MRVFITLLFLVWSISVCTAKKLKVLFIGNSYTYVNNMPQIVADIATAMGDTLVWDMEAPGGFSLGAHYQYSPPTLNKIKAGGWDYVVLQEQSQTPAYPDNQVNNGMFPFAHKLDSLIHLYNSCAETIFYMTWGRKNGDTLNCAPYTINYGWPHFCTYLSMDSVIRLRYRMMADSNKGVVAAAGAVWRYIRVHYPYINLYDADESHPSYAGSYAAACTFYTTLFRKDPTTITYNGSLNSIHAVSIRTAVEKVVQDSLLYWHIGQYKVAAGFTKSVSGMLVSFTNTSVIGQHYNWYFGDGQQSTQTNPVHTYASTGNYTIMLVATDTNKNCSDTAYSKINIFPASITEPQNGYAFSIAPNPVHDVLTVSSPLFQTSAYSIKIQNQFGQVIYTTEINLQAAQQVNLSAQIPGVYSIAILKDGISMYRCKVLKY